MAVSATLAAAEKLAESEDPPARTEYMGRTIARTMGWQGAPWLIRKEREEQERASEMLAQLDVEPGMVIADIGCGNGFYALPLAEKVLPDGKVYGVDIQSEMLVFMKKRAGSRGLRNIVAVENKLWDVMLPADSIDLSLMVDVYHEFSHPELMLRSLHRAMKTDGVVVLLEFRSEDPEVPIKPLHKMTKAQCLKEFEANGFALVKEYDKLPWQHMLFFKKKPLTTSKK
ncbi:MAG: class I SAM-dependent methyltransferase [Verrucomicrobiota bacterium]